jgi:hypothetical protein
MMRHNLSDRNQTGWDIQPRRWAVANQALKLLPFTIISHIHLEECFLFWLQ